MGVFSADSPEGEPKKETFEGSRAGDASTSSPARRFYSKEGMERGVVDIDRDVEIDIEIEVEEDEDIVALRRELQEAKARVKQLENILQDSLTVKRRQKEKEKRREKGVGGGIGVEEDKEEATEGFNFVFSSGPGRETAADLAEDMDTTNSTSTTRGEGQEGEDGEVEVDVNVQEEEEEEEEEEDSLSSPFQFVFSSPPGGSTRSQGGSRSERKDAEEKVFDFVFSSPPYGTSSSANAPPTVEEGAEEMDEDEKENTTGNTPYPFVFGHQKNNSNSNSTPSMASPSKQDHAHSHSRKKSNVESLGERLSQRLAESLSGLFIDMSNMHTTETEAGPSPTPVVEGASSSHPMMQEGGDSPAMNRQGLSFHSNGSRRKEGKPRTCCEELEQAQRYKQKGNNEFSHGLFRKATQSYTSCINACFLITVQNFKLDDSSVSPSAYRDAIKMQADALSNRAAAHIMLDNASLALDDCEEALRIFPEHERAQVRRATTKLYMCQFEDAHALLVTCLQKTMQGKGLDADVREKLSVVEAILRLINVEAKAFPMNKTTAEELVGKIGKHLEYLPKSRALIEAKCNILLSLHEYSEVTSVLSKVKSNNLLPSKVFVSQYAKNTCEFDSGLQWLEALACSGLGNLEKAVKLGEMCCGVDDCAIHESIRKRIDKWKKILELKREANGLFGENNKRSQDLYTQAIKLAVSPNLVECPPFTAILYCNRSATYQKESDMLSALSDCVRACALHPTYIKAFTRAASICEDVCLYELSMQFLKEITGNVGQEKLSKKDSKSIAQKLRQLSQACKDDRHGDLKLPNYYKFFSLDMNAQYSDIKKTYHKAALRFHPDKDALCGHVSMDKMNLVFSLIREAYEVLSEPQGKAEYDRKLLHQMRGHYTSRNAFHNHNGHPHSTSASTSHGSGSGSFHNNWTHQKSSRGKGNKGGGKGRGRGRGRGRGGGSHVPPHHYSYQF